MPAPMDQQDIAEWALDRPMFESFEDPTNEVSLQTPRNQYGALGISYTDGVDSRWGRLTLGPEFNSISLAAVGGTAANANGVAVIKETGAATWHIYVPRGTQTADIVASTMALTGKSAPAALAERCTSILVTKAANGNIELTEAMAATAYRCRTTIATTPTADTVATNSASAIMQIIGDARNRIAGFAGDIAYGNILSGSVTMASPSWSTVGTYYGGGTTPTGFAMNQNIWTWCTNKGVLYLDSLISRFVESFPSMSPDSDNGRAVKSVPYIGTVVPMRTSVRRWRGRDSETIGPERWQGNESPIKGVLMGQGFDERWAVWAYKNGITGTTYFLAVRPRQPGDGHGNPLSFYCIGSQATACEVVEHLGTINGSQTQPIWMVGSGSDVKYFKAGLTDRWIDDTGYRYQSNTTQTAYLTELRRYADQDKRPTWIDLETINTSSTKTVMVNFVGVDSKGNSTTMGAPIIVDAPGRVRIPIPESQTIVARRIQPTIALLSDSNTTSPQVVGRFVVGYTRSQGEWA